MHAGLCYSVPGVGVGRARSQGQPWGATMGLHPRGPRLDSNHGWGEQWRTAPRSAGQGSGGLLGWLRPLKFQVSEGRNREQPQKLGRSQMTRTESQGPSRPLSQADLSSLHPLTKGRRGPGLEQEKGLQGARAPAVGSGAPEDRQADSGHKRGWGPFSSAGQGVRMNFGPIYQHFLRTSEALALDSAHTSHHDRE